MVRKFVVRKLPVGRSAGPQITRSPAVNRPRSFATYKLRKIFAFLFRSLYVVPFRSFAFRKLYPPMSNNIFRWITKFTLSSTWHSRFQRCFAPKRCARLLNFKSLHRFSAALNKTTQAVWCTNTISSPLHRIKAQSVKTIHIYLIQQQ